MVAVKAIGFWLGLTAVGIWTAPYIERVINHFRTPEAGLVLMLALAFLAAGMAELAGLAFIIGAFSIGLALSTTELGHRVEKETAGISQFLVPVFFVVMGMLVDVGSMLNAVVFGLVLSVLAIFFQGFWLRSPGPGDRVQFSGQRQNRRWDDPPGRVGADYRRNRPLPRYHWAGSFRRQHHDDYHHRFDCAGGIDTPV